MNIQKYGKSIESFGILIGFGVGVMVFSFTLVLLDNVLEKIDTFNNTEIYWFMILIVISFSVSLYLIIDFGYMLFKSQNISKVSEK